MKTLYWIYDDKYEIWALWDEDEWDCIYHAETWSEKNLITKEYEKNGYVVKDKM